MNTTIHCRAVDVDEISIFYREAGFPDPHLHR